MDYLKIVLHGYFNDNNKKYLSNYFYREFKKAEKEQFFESKEFFHGCLTVLEKWEKNLQDQIHDYKRELGNMISAAKNGTLKYDDLEGKTIEQKRHETIEFYKNELKNIRVNSVGSTTFSIHLFSLTNGQIRYNMEYNELLEIKIALDEAFKKTQLQQTTTESVKPKYFAKHYVLAYLFECHTKGESLPNGEKKKLENIGVTKMGAGKGNRFYKAFNEIVNKDINSEKNLIEIGGENWRTIVKDLSKEPETIEAYLQSKKL